MKIYDEDEWNGYVLKTFNAMLYVTSFLLVLSIVMAGGKFAALGGSPSGRMQIQETVINWILTILLLGLTPTLAIFFMEINEAVVHLFLHLLPGAEAALLENGDPRSVVMAQQYTGNWFLTFLVKLVMIGLVLYFNVLYLLRRYVILALFVVSPVVIWAWGKGRQVTFYLWAAELTSAIFMQTVHAITFYLYFQMLSVAELPWSQKLILLLFVVSVSILLRKLISGWLGIIGLSEEKQAAGAYGGLVGATIGLVGLGGVGRLAYSLTGGGGRGGGPGGEGAAASSTAAGKSSLSTPLASGGASAGAASVATAGLAVAGLAGAGIVNAGTKLTGAAVESGTVAREGHFAAHRISQSSAARYMPGRGRATEIPRPDRKPEPDYRPHPPQWAATLQTPHLGSAQRAPKY